MKIYAARRSRVVIPPASPCSGLALESCRGYKDYRAFEYSECGNVVGIAARLAARAAATPNVVMRREDCVESGEPVKLRAYCSCRRARRRAMRQTPESRGAWSCLSRWRGGRHRRGQVAQGLTPAGVSKSSTTARVGRSHRATNVRVPRPKLHEPVRFVERDVVNPHLGARRYAPCAISLRS